MLKNYFKIALRTLAKQKVFTLINVVGLATGIASCVLIMLFVLDEWSYDRFHARGENIYKLAVERRYPHHVTHYALVPIRSGT